MIEEDTFSTTTPRGFPQGDVVYQHIYNLTQNNNFNEKSVPKNMTQGQLQHHLDSFHKKKKVH